MSTFGGIETALSALRAAQVMVETSTQNTANANNPNYSRQVVDLQANPAYPAPGMTAVGPGQIGTGVSVTGIQRMTDSYTTSQLRLALSQQNADTVTQNTTSQIQSMFNELSGSGISTELSQFWSSWQDVSNSPTDSGVRTSLIDQAQSLATSIQQAASQLTSLQQNLDQQVTQQVSTVNTLTNQIAGLNQQIVVVQATGQQPNDLLDQRDALLSQLSGLAQVQIDQQSNGAVQVTLGGKPLVDGSTSFALSTATNSNGLQNIVASDGTVIQPQNGSLAALEQMRDGEIPSRLNALNAFTQRLITAVNAVHEGTDPTTGATVTNVYNLVAPGTPSQTPFFTGTDATNIAVNSALVQNPNLIAASQTPNGPGDGSNALAIANLQNDPTAGGAATGSPTIDDQYQQFATDIGASAATAESNATDQQVLVNNLQQQQAQVSGVSLDQEAANLITYQQAYQAAAKAMTVFDTLLDTLINKTS